MAAKKKSALTTVQKKVMKGAVANLEKAYADARRKLAAAGISPNDGSTKCLASPAGHCRAFKRPAQGLRCSRPGCGHSFFRHDVF